MGKMACVTVVKPAAALRWPPRCFVRWRWSRSARSPTSPAAWVATRMIRVDMQRQERLVGVLVLLLRRATPTAAPALMLWPVTQAATSHAEGNLNRPHRTPSMTRGEVAKGAHPWILQRGALHPVREQEGPVKERCSHPRPTRWAGWDVVDQQPSRTNRAGCQATQS